jgi:hypothetical protein
MNFHRLFFPFLLEPAGDAGAAGAGSGGGSSSAASPVGSSAEAGGAATGASSGDGGASAAGAFDFRTLVNETGGFVEGWQEKLPGEFDPHRKTLANFKDFGSLSKSLADNMATARAKTEGMVKIPGADAKPEEVAAYRQAMGIPEKAEDYGLKAPEQLPEGVVWDEGFANEFTKAAHEAGMSKAQVEKLSAWHLQAEAQRAQRVFTEGTRLYEAEQGKLRQAFGSQYDKRMVDVQRVAATLGLPDDHVIFWRADTVQALAKVADLVSEDKLVTSHQVQNKLSPETAAKDIQTNPDNPDYKAYTDPGHPRHKEVVSFVTEQMKRAFPERR